MSRVVWKSLLVLYAKDVLTDLVTIHHGQPRWQYCTQVSAMLFGEALSRLFLSSTAPNDRRKISDEVFVLYVNYDFNVRLFWNNLKIKICNTICYSYRDKFYLELNIWNSSKVKALKQKYVLFSDDDLLQPKFFQNEISNNILLSFFF